MLDVLEYNQLVQQYNNLQPQLTSAKATAQTWYSSAYTCGQNAGANISFVGALNASTAKQSNFPYLLGCALNTTPWCCCLWSNIPCITSGGTVCGGVTVFDSSGNGNQGVCCLWTVPAGATYAQFQIWGAGAASKGGFCCSLSMWGGSGAYASVIIPVVPGCQYTLCAGCAMNCCYYCTQGSDTYGNGCMSYVTGYGLNNFCADGGDASAANWLYRVAQGAGGGCAGYCVIQNNTNGYGKFLIGVTYGYCMCSYGWFCFGQSCSSFDMLPFTTSCSTYHGNLTIPATKACHFVIGAPGMYNASCGASTWDGYRYMVAPPIVNLTGGCCAACYTATSMNGGSCWNYNQGYLQYPGRGGASMNVNGGQSGYGGMGTGGMVCVSYITAT